NTVRMIRARHQLERRQRRLFLFLWVGLLGCVFLMSPASAPIWRSLPLLHRIQFPWRFMVVVTVCAAGLAGAVLPTRRALPLVVCAVVASAPAVRPYQPLRPIRYPHPARAEDIAQSFFTPDRDFHEWLPKGATPWPREGFPESPTCTPSCRIVSFERTQGRL